MSKPTRSSIHPALRVVVGLFTAALGSFGAFIAWFGGVVTFTGCLIGCTEPDRLMGLALFTVVSGLVGGVFVAVDFAIRGWDPAAVRRVFSVGVVGGVVLAVLSVLAG